MAGTEDQALQDLSDMVMAGVADLWIALVLGRTDHGRSGGELRLVPQVLGQVSHHRLANDSSIADFTPQAGQRTHGAQLLLGQVGPLVQPRPLLRLPPPSPSRTVLEARLHP